MKAFLLFAFALALSVRAQNAPAGYLPEQLDELLGPIALYPDPLVAIILPASTVPADVARAAAYLAGGGNAGGIDAQPWDPSVRALAHYPEVVQWMNANLAWTQALGAAFTLQPAEVLKSVQQLRAQARAAGTLVSTPQQQIVVEGDNLRIIPAQPDIIYVPAYDPGIVYEMPVGYGGPFISFGVGFPVGAWLGFQCNWDDYGIWYGSWAPGWGYRREWRNAASGRNVGHAWHPDARGSRALVRDYYRPDGRLPGAGLRSGYHGPARPAGAAPRSEHAFAPARADFRGRVTAAPRPAGPAPRSPLFGGYHRGSQTRDFSTRGNASRAAPVRPRSPARAPGPSRGAAPARPTGPGPAGNRDRR